MVLNYGVSSADSMRAFFALNAVASKQTGERIGQNVSGVCSGCAVN
jgi:hypothetical protein